MTYREPAILALRPKHPFSMRCFVGLHTYTVIDDIVVLEGNHTPDSTVVFSQLIGVRLSCKRCRKPKDGGGAVLLETLPPKLINQAFERYGLRMDRAVRSLLRDQVEDMTGRRSPPEVPDSEEPGSSPE